MLDFFYITVITIVSLSLINSFAKPTQLLRTVYLMHVGMGIAYYLVITKVYGYGDAMSYYYRAQFAGWESFKTGTHFIDFILSPFVQLFNMSMLSLSILFANISYWGLVLFFRLLTRNFTSTFFVFGYPSLLVVLFIPSFHFWTSSIGKDSLIFLALMGIFYGLSTSRYFSSLTILSIFLVLMIRPYLLAVILLSLGFVLSLKNLTSFNFKSVLLFLAVLVGGVLFLPIFKEYMHIEEVNVNTINNTFSSMNSHGRANDGSSNIDVSGYPLPLKMLSFLFRPLPFEARSIMQLVTSIENMFLLVLFFKWFFVEKVYLKYKYQNFVGQFLIVYFFVGLFIFSMSMYNLGLASRQKYMILPALFISYHTLAKHRFHSILKNASSKLQNT